MIAVYMDIDVAHHEWWSGAEDTVKKCVDAGKAEELEALIKENFANGEPDETEVNDFLRFEDAYIFKALGIPDDDGDEDEEDFQRFEDDCLSLEADDSEGD